MFSEILEEPYSHVLTQFPNYVPIKVYQTWASIVRGWIKFCYQFHLFRASFWHHDTIHPMRYDAMDFQCDNESKYYKVI